MFFKVALLVSATAALRLGQQGSQAKKPSSTVTEQHDAELGDSQTAKIDNADIDKAVFKTPPADDKAAEETGADDTASEDSGADD